MSVWMATYLLRNATKNPFAEIVSMTVPMRSNPIVTDEYDQIMSYVFPLCLVLMYILPISRMTSRIVKEKETRSR